MPPKVCRRTGKRGYRSVKEAEVALRELEQNEMHMSRRYERTKRETAAFKCLFCPRWHLTSERQDGNSNGINLR